MVGENASPIEDEPESVEETLETPTPAEDPRPLPVEDVAAQAPAPEVTAAAMTAWTEALHSVERSINDAVEAIRFLRSTMQEMAPLLRSIEGLENALRGFQEPSPERRAAPRMAAEPQEESSWHEDENEQAEPEAPTAIRLDEAARAEREWQAIKRKPASRERVPQVEPEKSEWVPADRPTRPALKPVTLVPDDTPAPYAYRVTVEDRKSPVELVRLHQALSSIASVRNLSLLNYVNGVASLSLESMDEIQPAELENAVRKTMKRSCSVVPHESNTLLVQVGD